MDQHPRRSSRFSVATTDGFQNKLQGKLRKYEAYKFPISAPLLDYLWIFDLPDRLYNCDTGDSAHHDHHDHRDSFLDGCARDVHDGGANRLLAWLPKSARRS